MKMLPFFEIVGRLAVAFPIAFILAGLAIEASKWFGVMLGVYVILVVNWAMWGWPK